MSNQDNPLETMKNLGDALPEQDEKKPNVAPNLTHSDVIKPGFLKKVILRARLSKTVKQLSKEEKQCIQAETEDGKFVAVYYRGSSPLPIVERGEHRQLITLTDAEVRCQTPKNTTDQHVYIIAHKIDVFDDVAGATWLSQRITTKEDMDDTQFGVLRLESVVPNKKVTRGNNTHFVTRVEFLDSEETAIRMVIWEPFLQDANKLQSGTIHFVVGAGKLKWYGEEAAWFVNYNESTIIQQVPDEKKMLSHDKDEKAECDDDASHATAQPDRDENKGQE